MISMNSMKRLQAKAAPLVFIYICDGCGKRELQTSESPPDGWDEELYQVVETSENIPQEALEGALNALANHTCPGCQNVDRD